MEPEIKALGSLSEFGQTYLMKIEEKVAKLKDKMGESLLGFSEIEHFPTGHFLRRTAMIGINSSQTKNLTTWPDMEVLN